MKNEIENNVSDYQMNIHVQFRFSQVSSFSENKNLLMVLLKLCTAVVTIMNFG